MSLSKPQEQRSKNPSKKFIKWKGSRLQGFFVSYNKELKKDETIDLSKGFILLDKDLFSITGFNDQEKSNITSNEVRTIHDKLVVKEWKDKKSKVLMEGPYSELKSAVSNSKVLRYTRSVYIYLLETKELCHIQLTGRTFSEFLTSIENSNDAGKVVCVKAVKDAVQGSVEYKYAEWGYLRDATEEEMESAIEADKILQAYLEEYFTKGKTGPDAGPSGEEEFDSKNWREFKCPNGSQLGMTHIDELQVMRQSMIESGDVDSKFFECIDTACREYALAVNTWRDKTTKDGKKLGSLTIEELSGMLAALESKAPMHPSRFFLVAGVNEIMAECEDDDIPF